MFSFITWIILLVVLKNNKWALPISNEESFNIEYDLLDLADDLIKKPIEEFFQARITDNLMNELKIESREYVVNCETNKNCFYENLNGSRLELIFDENYLERLVNYTKRNYTRINQTTTPENLLYLAELQADILLKLKVDKSTSIYTKLDCNNGQAFYTISNTQCTKFKKCQNIDDTYAFVTLFKCPKETQFNIYKLECISIKNNYNFICDDSFVFKF
jgi:hypothetical protein